MSIHRNLAGLPVLIESPSRYRIVTPNLETIHLKSWLEFVGDGWTIKWDDHGRQVTSFLRWANAYEVALYLVMLGRGEVQA